MCAVKSSADTAFQRDTTPLAFRLGQALRAHRRATSPSHDDFSDQIHMHRAYYCAIERGEKIVTLVTLHRIARDFGVSMSMRITDVDCSGVSLWQP